MTEPTPSAATVDAGMRVVTINGIPYALEHRAGLATEFVSLESTLARPVTHTRRVTVETPAALVEYLTLFGDPERTIIFANRVEPTLTAVVDFDTSWRAADAGWARHRAVCTLEHPPAWVEWLAANKTPMAQTAFGAFLEEHIPDIAEPNGADLVELARDFEATKAVSFRSTIRDRDGGVHCHYVEEVAGTSKSGELKIPERFTVALAPFYGSKTYPVTARLRYRLQGAALSLSYDLVRVQDVLDAAWAELVAEVTEKTQATVRAVVRGSVARATNEDDD